MARIPNSRAYKTQSTPRPQQKNDFQNEYRRPHHVVEPQDNTPSLGSLLVGGVALIFGIALFG